MKINIPIAGDDKEISIKDGRKLDIKKIEIIPSSGKTVKGMITADCDIAEDIFKGKQGKGFYKQVQEIEMAKAAKADKVANGR